MKNKDFKIKSTSSNFLQTRIQVNSNSTNNFDHWSVSLFPKLSFGANILDLGCGTGKQINLFSPFLTKKSNYYCCDYSKESVKAVEKSYTSKPNLTLINDSFDNIEKFFSDDLNFDLIYSFYALYYTENLQNLMDKIFSKLKKNGVLWVVMPYSNTNKELFDILETIYNIDEKVKYSINGFAHDLIECGEKSGFLSIDINLFENKIIFDNKEKLFNYIENTTFFEHKYKESIEEEINKVFDDKFLLTKEVISIKLTK